MPGNAPAVVVPAAYDFQLQAKSLADLLNLPFAESLQPEHNFALVVSDKNLVLHHNGEPLPIELFNNQMRYRCQHATIKKELLARSIGVLVRENALIVDATAGLGRDSLLLASLGFRVTSLERSPIIFALLQNALSRAAQDSFFAPIIARITLLHTDALYWLKQASSPPRVIYIDPMFPARNKSALVKKEMVMLQTVLGTEGDETELFQQALSCAQYRVVVKRPRLGPWIDERKPSFSLTGSSSRFDVYQICK